MTELNKILTKVETGFNIVDSMPLVALVTSPLRCSMGKVITIAGVVLIGMGFVGQMVRPQERSWKHLTGDGEELVMHGLLNILRSVGEFLLACTLVGSMGLFFGQLVSSNKFAPIIKYNHPFGYSEGEIIIRRL